MLSASKDAAKQAGVHPITLHRWVKEGKVKPPKPIRVGTRSLYLWSKRDIERIRRYKARHYWKGRGRRTNLHGR